LKWIAAQQYKVADIIGVQSPGNLNYFKHWHEARKGRSIEVLQNWLAKRAKVRCSIRIDETSLAGRKVLVHAGNMGVAQGLDTLLELSDRLKTRKDIGFLFVGRGTKVRTYRKVAAARGLDNVLFHWEIEPDEIPDLYSQCHAGIVALDPRHKSHNIPGKFLSYMQNGLPVLANINVGNDLADLIRSQRVGEVCETNCVGELEQRCFALIERIDTDTGLPERCINLFQSQFSVSQTVDQIVASLSGKT
jgi:hypothetical protein